MKKVKKYPLERRTKLAIIVALIGIGLLSTGIIIIFLPPTLQERSPANTYINNSIINNLGYSVIFKNNNILLENILQISNGIINGYPVTNSTELQNCTINNYLSLRSIDLQENQKLTLRNIWSSNLMIMLVDNSTLKIYNCSLGAINLRDSSTVEIHNSTLYSISGHDGSISIDNSSKVFFIQIISHTSFEIRESNVNYIYLINYPNYFMETQQQLYGYIANSSIESIYSEVFGFLSIYGSTISNLTVRDQSQVFLNETTILRQLHFGIKVTSGNLEYINGVIVGSNFFNNTSMKNSHITKTIFDSISLSSTASIQIVNYSGYLYLHNSALAKISNSSSNPTISNDQFYQIELDGISIESNTVCFFILDSSQLILEDSNITFIYAMGNSSVIVRANSIIGELILDTSNLAYIESSIIEDLYILSEPVDLSSITSIFNSHISYLHINPISITYIEGCLVDSLYEGFYMDSGKLTWDYLGFSGTGLHKNKTIIINSVINIRSIRYIRLINSASLLITNIFNDIKIIISESASVRIEGSRISYIEAKDSSHVFVKNCEFFSPAHFGEQFYGTINLYDKASLFLEDDMGLSIMQCIMYDSSVASITDSYLWGIIIDNHSIATIKNSNIIYILVTGYSQKDYSLKLYDSEAEILDSFLVSPYI